METKIKILLLKAFVLSFLTSCIYLFSSFNNNGFAQKVNFGLSYGANCSFWNKGVRNYMDDLEVALQDEGINTTLNNSPRININIGLYVTIKVVDWLRIQPEVNYIPQGTRISGNCNIDGVDVKF